MIPVIKYSDGTSANDSTFIFEELDRQYQSRPLIPREPVRGFLSMLLEDMFDEWGTKAMFGMRWQRKVDQDWSGAWLLYDTVLGTGQPLDQVYDNIIYCIWFHFFKKSLFCPKLKIRPIHCF